MKQKHAAALAPPALTATQVIAGLAQLNHWRLCGDGPDVAIEKTFSFPGYLQTIAFVNAVAFIAEAHAHHPELLVHYDRCSVRWNTHDAQGITDKDFACATKVDALF